MIEKARVLLWFVRRPKYWRHMSSYVLRTLTSKRNSAAERKAARLWAEQNAVSVNDCLERIGLSPGDRPNLGIDGNLIREGRERARRSHVKMGGAGDLSLLHSVVKLTNARTVVETGVAYGWSSLAILAGFGRPDARLISVDMPYPTLGNEPFVGIVVPDELRTRWTLIREPDRPGLKKAIALAGGPIDVCHYDSDQAYEGRRYGYPLLWDALAEGGVFISDDIQDNLAFKEFSEEKGLPFAVVGNAGKYAGVIRKRLSSR